MSDGIDRRAPGAPAQAAPAAPAIEQAPLKLVTVVTSSIVDFESETSQVTRVPTEKERSDPYIGTTIHGS